jgi:hypothetical protein
MLRKILIPPPNSAFKEIKKAQRKVSLFKAIPSISKYHWDTSKLIEYTNAEGGILNVLCYPANYNPKHKISHDCLCLW